MTLAIFGSIGPAEIIVILVIAVLLFGRRLPEVGRTVGKTLFQVRKGLDDIKGDFYNNTGDIREEMNKTKRDLNRALHEPIPERKKLDEIKEKAAAQAKEEADEEEKIVQQQEKNTPGKETQPGAVAEAGSDAPPEKTDDTPPEENA